MRRYFGLLCVLLFTVIFFASCLNTDEDETVLYDDTALTSFAISTAKIYSHTTSSTGMDSVYYTTNSEMDDYPFYIDQLNGLVYNADSLPEGTDVTKLLCTYGSKNNGMVLIENVARDSLKSLSTTDSIDFSQPRYLRVYASDASSYRSYLVTVNVHKEDADSFQWKRMAYNGDIAALSEMKAVAFGGCVYLFGSNGTSTSMYTTSDGSTWTKSALAFAGDAYKNAVVATNTLFILDSDTLRATDDGVYFHVVNSATGLKSLVGGCSTELYGISDNGQLMKSEDGGVTWVADAADDDSSLLPTEYISFCSTTSSSMDSTDNVLLVGSRSLVDYPSEANSVVWSKTVEYAQDSKAGSWMYINFDDSDIYPLPRLKDLNVFSYGEHILALGMEGLGGCTSSAFSQVYDSRDGGITWKRNASFALPSSFDRSATSFAVTVDKSNFIWIICGGTGQIWRGRLNGMAK